MDDRLKALSPLDRAALFPVILRRYDPSWREWFACESERLSLLLREDIHRLSHIGSTAVEGLLAKPTVDILLEVKDGCETAVLVEAAEKAGYFYDPETSPPGVPMVFMKGYTADGYEERVFHLHVRPAGMNDELYFRDYLRDHPRVRSEYAELKKRLAQEYKHDRETYTGEKTDFIKQHTQNAKKLYGKSYDP